MPAFDQRHEQVVRALQKAGASSKNPLADHADKGDFHFVRFQFCGDSRMCFVRRFS
ncbi:MAG: hypothetical protein HXY40_18650 [Chloroflexi bacterium]|nr:hypothetical protein [Chloroflexota bacterium]